MTVDLEEYFQVSAFDGIIARGDWDRLPSRVESSTDRVLGLFDANGVHATFFILGWIAERHPALIRRIADAGHEIASHGYAHVRVDEQKAGAFSEEVSRTKALLEDLSGCEVQGFRAASFSIGAANLWALDVLHEAGYRYSSSIYPIRHDLYGMPSAPRFAFAYRQGGIVEIPVTTLPVMGRNFPCGGGGYFRLYPYAFSRWAIGRVNSREQRSAVFYFHPWELDPEQPRQRHLGFRTRFRHYFNLHRMTGRLSRLLADFSWGRMDEVFSDLSHGERARESAYCDIHPA